MSLAGGASFFFLSTIISIVVAICGIFAQSFLNSQDSDEKKDKTIWKIVFLFLAILAVIALILFAFGASDLLKTENSIQTISLAEDAFFFFLSGSISIIVAISSIFAQSLLNSQSFKESKYRYVWIAIFIFLILLTLAAFLLFAHASFSLSSIENSIQIPSNPSNTTINQIDNYYNNTYSVNITYYYSNNLDIVDILNSHNPKIK